ncbi:hypothetical protein HY624_04105 [Candidatus Uhrbacteria bacterium]|nr:hypothetical protein [Candidatus Uhrbacteria bacterium]
MFFQLFFKNIILDFLYFPVWWYTRGFVDVLRWAGNSVQARESAIGIRIWIANLFVPMYGQSDWQGRSISFVFRVLILLVRSFLFFLWVFIICALVLAYLVWPIGAAFGFITVFLTS